MSSPLNSGRSSVEVTFRPPACPGQGPFDAGPRCREAAGSHEDAGVGDDRVDVFSGVCIDADEEVV